MAWSFFEAGQFSATLPGALAKEAGRRMVCLYDKEIPSILAPLQGVKVTTTQKSGAKIDMDMPAIRTNSQYDETYIYSLFEDMLNNKPLGPIRDVSENSVKEDIREQCHKIISLFEASGGYPVDDRPLQPRIWYELALGGNMNNETKIHGDNDSLNTLFSIATKETTWGAILNLSAKAGEPKPLWAQDVESAALSLASDINPKTSTSKSVLKGRVYCVFTPRYQVFKDRRKCVYVGFLESVPRPFDLNRASGLLLSALILGVRFRERLIPMHKQFEEADANFEDILISFYRELQAVEIEALQYGLNSDVSNPDDYPILTIIREPSRRENVEKGIKQWSKDRKEITSMFMSSAELSKNARVYGDKLSKILQETAPINSAFIQVMSEELEDQIST